MAWVVDSCVLLDVARKDPRFGYGSAILLDQKRSDGLVACPVSVIEITPEFGGTVAETKRFLYLAGIVSTATWTDTDTDTAALTWSEYVQRKRAGATDRRPVADILIGAFCCRFQGLITRNPAHFRPHFPDLVILEPQTVEGDESDT